MTNCTPFCYIMATSIGNLSLSVCRPVICKIISMQFCKQENHILVKVDCGQLFWYMTNAAGSFCHNVHNEWLMREWYGKNICEGYNQKRQQDSLNWYWFRHCHQNTTYEIFWCQLLCQIISWLLFYWKNALLLNMQCIGLSKDPFPKDKLLHRTHVSYKTMNTANYFV